MGAVVALVWTLAVGQAAGGPAADSAKLRGEARAALDAGSLDRAWALIESTRKVRDPVERGAWWALESETEFGRRRYVKAALAGMRVAILRPRSLHAGTGLYWAGRSYEELGRSAKAAELYGECVANKRTAQAVRRLAEGRLQALKAKDQAR